MTAIYEDHIREVNERKVIKRVCDRCGLEIKVTGYTDIRAFRLCFVEQKHLAEGSRYREGWRVNDLCDNCVKLLKHWLKENNVRLEERTIADAPSLDFTCSDDTGNLL